VVVVRRVIRRGFGVVVDGGGGGKDSGVNISVRAMPSRVRGCDGRSDGITLLIVARAFFARASFRKDAGGRPAEGLVRPMMGLTMAMVEL